MLSSFAPIWRSVTSFCEHGNETSDYIKHQKFFEQLNDYKFSRKAFLHGIGWLSPSLVRFVSVRIHQVSIRPNSTFFASWYRYFSLFWHHIFLTHFHDPSFAILAPFWFILSDLFRYYFISHSTQIVCLLSSIFFCSYFLLILWSTANPRYNGLTGGGDVPLSPMSAIAEWGGNYGSTPQDT
jgi:hypothetical protein